MMEHSGKANYIWFGDKDGNATVRLETALLGEELRVLILSPAEPGRTVGDKDSGRIGKESWIQPADTVLVFRTLESLIQMAASLERASNAGNN